MVEVKPDQDMAQVLQDHIQYERSRVLRGGLGPDSMHYDGAQYHVNGQFEDPMVQYSSVSGEQFFGDEEFDGKSPKKPGEVSRHHRTSSLPG